MKAFYLLFAAGVVLVACGVTGGPSLLGSSSPLLGRTIVQPRLVTCSPAGFPFGGGSGTSGNPYAICTAAQLQQIGPAFGTANYFVLASDLDVSAVINFPKQTLNGQLDGNRHVISNLNQSSMTSGMLDIMAGSTVKDLGLALGTFVNTGSSGATMGSLVNTNAGTISGCYVTGTMDTDIGTMAGGLVYDNQGSITNSYVILTLQYSGAVGGVIVQGGLTGNDAGTITNSYAVTTFTQLAAPSTNISDPIDVGSAQGSPSGNVSGSFWDTTVSAMGSSAATLTAGSGGKTTAAMKTAATYMTAAWSTSAWYVIDGAYPKFTWQP